MVSADGSLGDRLEALELEFNLLKTEIRQTLVDVKEFVMKGKSVNAERRPMIEAKPTTIGTNMQSTNEEQYVDAYSVDQDVATDSDSVTIGESPVPTGWVASPQDRGKDSSLATSNKNDSTMMKNIIWWLGTARRRGITLNQLSPFIEAYEMSGYMSPLVSKLIYKTMAQLADEESATVSQRMPQDFSDGLMQLNEIITTPNYDIQQKNLNPDLLGPIEQLIPNSEENNDWETSQ
jgi:hypothetical protein